MSRRYFWFDDITEVDPGQLPEGIPTVVLTGTYLSPNGLPYSGKVEITPPGALSFGDQDVIVTGPAVIRLDGQGSFSARVPATDSTTNPVDWAYTITEKLDGFIDRPPYAIKLPAELATADLADLAPSDPETPNYVPVVGPPGPRGPRGATGPQGPQGLQGDPGTPGAHWTFGVGIPSHEAADGDLYADTATGDLYTRSDGAWSMKTNLKGPKGDPGDGAGNVISVNGIEPDGAGDVALTARDVKALPDTGHVGSAISFQQNGVDRWVCQVDEKDEAGSDTGSDFELAAWSDTGQRKPCVLYAKRETGSVGIGTNNLVHGAQLTVGGPVALADVEDRPSEVDGGVVAFSQDGQFTVKNRDGSTATLVDAVPTSEKGAPGGVAALDESGKLPMGQMPGEPVSAEATTNLDRVQGSITYQFIAPGVVFFALSVDASADPASGEASSLDVNLPFPVGGSSQGFVAGVWSRGSDTPNRTMVYAEPSPTNKTLVLWQQNDGETNGDWNRFGTARIAKGHHVTISGTLFSPGPR